MDNFRKYNSFSNNLNSAAQNDDGNITAKAKKIPLWTYIRERIGKIMRSKGKSSKSEDDEIWMQSDEDSQTPTTLSIFHPGIIPIKKPRVASVNNVSSLLLLNQDQNVINCNRSQAIFDNALIGATANKYARLSKNQAKPAKYRTQHLPKKPKHRIPLIGRCMSKQPTISNESIDKKDIDKNPTELLVNLEYLILAFQALDVDNIGVLEVNRFRQQICPPKDNISDQEKHMLLNCFDNVVNHAGGVDHDGHVLINRLIYIIHEKLKKKF
ncbi:hypothetical protein GJ496_006957 [Pomphorhynchus laevis]|nr:hypothetical protein GJ496_006957 [Pomphorhynchus laevis]